MKTLTGLIGRDALVAKSESPRVLWRQFSLSYSLPNYNLYNAINSFLVWLFNTLRNFIESQVGLAVGVSS